MVSEGEVAPELAAAPPNAGAVVEENAATVARAAVEEEKARVEAMEDGEEKDEALEKLAQLEAVAVEAEVAVIRRQCTGDLMLTTVLRQRTGGAAANRGAESGASGDTGANPNPVVALS